MIQEFTQFTEFGRLDNNHSLNHETSKPLKTNIFQVDYNIFINQKIKILISHKSSFQKLQNSDKKNVHSWS